MFNTKQKGLSLIELVVAIVLLGIGIGAIMGLVAKIGGSSSSPIIQTQAIYIAESYLEEVMLKDFQDPNEIVETCSTPRTLWDDVGDYNCLSSPTQPTDPFGNSSQLLSRYRVSVQIEPQQNISSVPTRKVSVVVSHIDGGINITLTGYKVLFP